MNEKIVCPNCHKITMLGESNKLKDQFICSHCNLVAVKTDKDASLNEAVSKTKLLKG